MDEKDEALLKEAVLACLRAQDVFDPENALEMPDDADADIPSGLWFRERDEDAVRQEDQTPDVAVPGTGHPGGRLTSGISCGRE